MQVKLHFQNSFLPKEIIDVEIKGPLTQVETLKLVIRDAVKSKELRPTFGDYKEE
jgi:hypothetical protein